MKTSGDCYRLGGGVIRIEWEDQALREILGRALIHRRVAASAPDLHIRARSGKHTWPAVPGGGLLVEDSEAGLEVIEPARRISSRVNATRTEAEFVCEAPELLQASERAAPFQLILQRWLSARRTPMLHAGAVGLPGHGAVLLAARSGGGKSNTMLACLDSPLHLLGEDYVAVGAAASPHVWALYNTAKLHPADLGRFPELADDAQPERDAINDKVVLQLARRHVARWTDGLPLRAILVLKVTGRPESRIVPAVPLEAVKELLASPLMLLPDSRRPLFEFVTRFAQSLPVRRLELGTEPRQVASVIHQFITHPPR